MDRPFLRGGKSQQRGDGESFSDFSGTDGVCATLTRVRVKGVHVGPLAGVQATGTTRRKGHL